VDQELIEYLDRRFNELRTDLRQELGGELRRELSGFREEFRDELRQELSGFREEFRGELRQELSGLREEFRGELRQELSGLREELRVDIAASAVETRRHFDVVAEQLMDKIQLVGEGVIGVDQKVDRLAAEMRTEFQNVDRRFLHLEARVIPVRD